MHLIRGMIQVAGTTYRIVQLLPGSYQVVRIRDEALVGEFACAQSLKVTAYLVDTGLMRRIAGTAVQLGRTSWMGPGRPAVPNLERAHTAHTALPA